MYKVNFYGFFDDFNKSDNFILDAIRKNGEVEISEHPDYVFFSVFDNEYLLHTNAVRIFFTGENVAPNFQLCDYAIGFERMDFGDRYLRFPFYYGMPSYQKDLWRAQQKHLCVESADFDRKFCSFVYSNSDTDGARKKLFDELNRYHHVDAGGKLFNNISERVTDKYEFEHCHKFSIACENSSHPGYCTEKIVQSFAAGTIPIYYGDATINMDFNEKAFVNCHKYSNIKEVVEFVKFLDQNRDAYFQMLSEPVYTDENYASRMQAEFENFIANIFRQPKEQAYRRNRFFWGEKLDRKYKKIYQAERIVKKILRR